MSNLYPTAYIFAMAAFSPACASSPGTALDGGATHDAATHDAATHFDAAASTGDGAVNGADQAAGESAEALCVATINMYRATLGLAPYARWDAKESCSDQEAQSDSMTGTAHGAFGQCGESAQNECPGWPAPPAGMIKNCLAQMWAEGPGSDFPTHGHYINMSSTQYTKVSCGFYQTSASNVWAVQNFQ